ncbi:MAG TPA: PAS domain-containing protein, partial [Bacteroidales bacterium]|nr:PAS domain-containing protein [Bacteroidales bacterium]
MKDKENLCNAIIKYSSDYIYTLKVKKDCITVKLENPGEGNVFGYLVDEINTLTDYVEKLVLPDDRFEVNSSVASVIKEGRNKTIEYKIKHKSGKISWVSNVLISNSKDSDLTYDAICLLKDISLRKYLEVTLQQADERYRNVFDQSGLASAVFDLSGKLIMQNLMAAKFLGGVPPDFIGKSVDEIYSPEVAKYIYSTLDATLKGVCLTRENEFLISKQKVWLKTTSHCVRNGNGETIGVQLISQNITEKKEWNKRMMQIMIETEEKE